MKTKEVKLTADMSRVVERLYTVFSGYQAPHGLLDVCTACCMDEALEKEMRRQPLRQLTERHFYQYNDSAKSAQQPGAEIKYFLPRLLELFAEDAYIHHSTEICLQRIGSCEIGTFSLKERAAIDDFAMAYFSELLGRHEWEHEGGFASDRAFEILLAFDIGGIDVQPLLAYWLQNSSAAATLHYISAGFYGFWNTNDIKNAFADDRPVFRETMRTWLSNAHNRQTFASRILDLDMKIFSQATACYYGAQLTPTEMAGSIFDLITE